MIIAIITMSYQSPKNNIISIHFIDDIIAKYVPDKLRNQDVVNGRRRDMKLFQEAMLHHSTQTQPEDKSYERLEYLGDAVFHFVLANYLFERYHEEDEGFLTKNRIKIERGESMAQLTRDLHLDSYIQSRQKINDHILEDVFESFIGAFFLNYGIERTQALIVAIVERHKDFSEIIYHDDNYKDLLLQYYHQMGWNYPVYEDFSPQQIAHIRNVCLKRKQNIHFKKFNRYVRNDQGRIIGFGCSGNKKKAEQLASEKALIKLGVIIDGEIDVDWASKITHNKTRDKADRVRDPDKAVVSTVNPNNKLIRKADVKRIISAYADYKSVQRDCIVDMTLFQEAMTHRSYIRHKNHRRLPGEKSDRAKMVPLQKKSNERLQFLGVAVIHFILAEFLYRRYPSKDEGFLTKLRCKLENTESLYYLACQIDIIDFVLVSQNIEISQQRLNPNIFGGALSAFVGCLFLQFGITFTKNFMCEVMMQELEIDRLAENETNYKYLVAQYYNQKGWGHPVYRTIREHGPDHSKVFVRGVYLRDQLLAQGKAKSKKKAEKIAACNLYKAIQAKTCHKN